MLLLARLARASTSASNAAFTRVSVNTALTLTFRLHVSLRASAFGKDRFQQGLRGADCFLKTNGLCLPLMLKAD
jgi:hypothetical protein